MEHEIWSQVGKELLQDIKVDQYNNYTFLNTYSRQTLHPEIIHNQYKHQLHYQLLILENE